jgi:thymidylate kinase
VKGPQVVVGAFDALDAAGIDYAVLHGFADLPSRWDSDVDIVVAGARLGDVAGVLRSYARTVGGDLVQEIVHETSSRYHVIAVPGDDGAPLLLQVDSCSSYRRNGRVLYSADELLAGRTRSRGLWVSSPDVEFGYYFAKRLLKGSWTAENERRLSDLCRADPSGCARMVARLLGAEGTQLIIDAAMSGDWETLREARDWLRKALLGHTLQTAPLRAVGYRLGEWMRAVSRFTSPTGFMIALLGPDGVGKSSVITGIEDALAPAFRSTQSIHLRPKLLGARGGADEVSAEPYLSRPYGAVGSVGKLGYLIADYVVGYWARVRPRLVRSALVVFDRYYADLIADPARYRYSGPPGLARFASTFVPGPDLYLVLDACVDTIQSRKREVSADVSGRQKDAYLRLAENRPRTVVVNADQSPNEVVRDAAWAVLHAMAKKVRA